MPIAPGPTGSRQTMPIAVPSNYETLSAMITPAIFMTANASLIVSTSNRMSRVVDRIRVLDDLADRLGRGVTELDYTAERLEHVHDQLHGLERRNDRIRIALIALYVAFASFVGTSLVLAIDAALNGSLIALPSLLAVCGVGLLLFASLNLVREALEALRTNRLEIRFYRELHERRIREGGTGPASGDPGAERAEAANRKTGPAQVRC
jgi:hypothetical protein